MRTRGRLTNLLPGIPLRYMPKVWAAPKPTLKPLLAAPPAEWADERFRSISDDPTCPHHNAVRLSPATSQWLGTR